MFAPPPSLVRLIFNPVFLFAPRGHVAARESPCMFELLIKFRQSSGYRGGRQIKAERSNTAGELHISGQIVRVNRIRRAIVLSRRRRTEALERSPNAIPFFYLPRVFELPRWNPDIRMLFRGCLDTEFCGDRVMWNDFVRIRANSR